MSLNVTIALIQTICKNAQKKRAHYGIIIGVMFFFILIVFNLTKERTPERERETDRQTEGKRSRER